VNALSEQLDQIAEAIRERFLAKHQAREQALPLSREAIRHSANAIRAIHRGDGERAMALREEAGRAVAAARDALLAYPDILYAGFVHDAQKEYAEASLTIALVCHTQLPSPAELGVEEAA
jgi:translin